MAKKIVAKKPAPKAKAPIKKSAVKTVAAKVLPSKKPLLKAKPVKHVAAKVLPAKKSILKKVADAVIEPIKEIPAVVASIPEKISGVIHPSSETSAPPATA